jgi:TonB-linked SusC/RagA family outer membrane protein
MRKVVMLFMAIALCFSHLYAQQRTITGKVTDESGNPVANASVIVKGSSIGTVTKLDGTYSLNVSGSAKVLVFSSVNMEPQEVNIGSQTSIDATLKLTNSSLQEVVVVGYSIVNKRNLTGAVSKISGKNIENKPVTSFDDALKGQAAGVFVNTSSGLVGDNVVLRIRGAASINNNSQPLIVIDGIPVVQGNLGQLYNPANGLSDLNPNDIESVEILKDASSAAIYGSRASAGVILITTKKGKPGSSKVSYDGYVGYTQPATMMDVLDASNYASVINKMRSNAGLTDVIKDGDYNNDGVLDPVNTDWQKEVYRNGFTQSHNVSISGGNEKITMFGSLSYLDFENYIINNRLRRGSARLNLTAKATSWLTLGVTSQYSRGFQYGIGSGTGGAASGIPLGPLRYYPNVPVKLQNGNYYLAQGGNLLTVGVIPNPVAVLVANYDNYDTRRFLASTYAEAQIIKGLKLKIQYNLDVRNSYDDQFWNPDVGDGAGLVGVAQNVDDENKNWSFFSTMNYNKRFGKHDIGVLAGTEFTKRQSHFIYSFGTGIKDRALLLLGTNNYTSVGTSEGFGENGLASYFGSVTYGFDNKYLFTGNFRADASSSFGVNHRFGYFPSASLAWKISEEKFFKGLKSIFNDLKLRGGYGVTGNNNIGNYTAFASYASVTYAELPNTAGISLNNPGNADLKWERSDQIDIGLDFNVWKGRISVNADYYKKRSRDLVLANPVLATLGFPGNSITENIGKLENKGVELTVQSDNVRGKDFIWTTNFNIAYSTNRVKATNATNTDIFGGNGIARPGVDLGTYYLIRWAGVNPETGWGMFYDVNGNKKMYNPSIANSANRWTDDKGATVTSAITAADRVVLKGKTPYPKFFGGLSNTLTYKQFDLSLDLQYSFGFYLYNTTLSGLYSYTSVTNKTTDILNAWTTPGQVTDIPKLYWNDNQWSQASTRWLEKGDFVRIRNIQWGYNIPKSIMSRAKLNSLRVYMQVENAYTFTGYKGTDPEANANGNTNIGLGIDNNRPYLPRTYTVGVNLVF